MQISQYNFLVFMIVIFVFTKQSQGNISASLAQTAEIEKVVVDRKFQDGQEAIIMAGTDRDSLTVRATIEAIRKETQKCSNQGQGVSLAVNTAVDGILTAVRLVANVVRQANKAIDAASNLLIAQNTEGAIDAIKKGFRVDRKMVFVAGVPIHDAQGFALGLAGGLALPGLRDTDISIQRGGSALFETLEIADEIATSGISEGGRAADEAFKSARNILSTGLLSVCQNLRKAAAYATEGLQYAITSAVNGVDVVPDIISSLKTPLSTDNPAALSAIGKLRNGLTSVLSTSTKKSTIDSANVMYEGLASTISKTVEAISLAKKTFEEAKELANQDPEAAVAVVHKGIKEAQDTIINASVFGFLSLGAVGQIAGKDIADKLIPAVIDIEHSRAVAYEDLGLAARAAIIGIRGGATATANGINTANQICDAAGITMYKQHADAGEIGFEVLQEV